MRELITSAFTQAACAAQAMATDTRVIACVEQAAQMLIEAFKNGNKVYSCGNGGSMSDAMHFAEELSGRFRENRDPLPALAISDPSHLSCVANDFGYDEVFSRFITAHARPGDVLLAISTSGKSPNILKAAAAAQAAQAKVIGLTGREGTMLEKMSDVVISTHMTGSPWSDRIQELHIKVIHTLIEVCEAELFRKKEFNYIPNCT